MIFKKPTPSQINLIKNVKKSFFISEKIQKYESAQLWKSGLLKLLFNNKKLAKGSSMIKQAKSSAP